MTLFSRFGFCGVLMSTAMLAAVILINENHPASAQGGIICKFGPTRYKRCCTDSYRQNPDLSASARADDIDACMKRSSRNPPSDKNPPAERTGDRARGDVGSRIRRLECGSAGCSGGCAADEIAVSAFCNVGGFPTPYGDRDVQCTSGSGVERPTVLICAKR